MSTSPGKSECVCLRQGIVLPSAISLLTYASVVFIAPTARWQLSPAVTLCAVQPAGIGVGGGVGGVGGGVGGGAVGHTRRLSPTYTSVGQGRPPSVMPER